MSRQIISSGIYLTRTSFHDCVKNVGNYFQIKRHNSSALLRTTLDGQVKYITMADHKTRNALSINMMEQLISEIKNDQDSPNLRVIVISAEGPFFSAGHNLKELKADLGKQQHEKVFSLATTLMLSIINCPVPIIAKVDGLAAAAGCQLIAQCDITVCSEESQFSTPGANFGIFCSTPGVALARSVSRKTALHMLFTGIPIGSKEAKESGLVSKVVSKDRLDQEVKDICHAIIYKSRSVIELGKKFFYQQVQEPIETAYEMGAQVMVDNTNIKDGQEGIQSFIEKRKPKW